MRSTCTITRPPQLRAAMAIDSASSVSASRSIVMLPSGSAVVPRTMRDVDREAPCRTGTPRRRSASASPGPRCVRALSLPPPRRGSTKVPRPMRREVPGLAAGDVAKQVRDHALRQVVGLDLVVDRELLQLRHQAPVAADGALHQPGDGPRWLRPRVLAVALAGGVEQGEVRAAGSAVVRVEVAAPRARSRLPRRSRCRRSRRSRPCRRADQAAPPRRR